MLSLTPSLQIVLPAPSHLLPCFSSPLPCLVCRCITATILSPPFPPPSLINSSFHLISPPYTSTHHPSSSLFCCYIIATITIPSTMQSLSPSPSDSPPGSLSPPSLFLPPSRSVCRCITATILSTPLPLTSLPAPSHPPPPLPPARHKKNPRQTFQSIRDSDKRRRCPTLPHCIAVPSAQAGLTSLFGMGRGGAPSQ